MCEHFFVYCRDVEGKESFFSSTCGKGETRGVQLMGGRRPHYIGNKSVINQDLEGAISRMEHLTRPLGQIYNTPSLASCPIHTEVFQKYT